jgi:DNA-binding MarR family transcriptional regulator
MDALRQIVRALRLSAGSVERQLGLSVAQLFVMQQLGEETLSVSELAERTLTDRSSVSVVVARLCERGLVSRKTSAEDRRRVEVTVTRKGRTVIARAPAPVQERLLEAVNGLPAAQRRHLARGLSAVARALGVDAALFFEE